MESARDKQLAALRREREGYVVRGNADRIQQVDKQIAALEATPGGATDAPAPQTAEQPEQPSAGKRTATPQGKRHTASE